MMQPSGLKVELALPVIKQQISRNLGPPAAGAGHAYCMACVRIMRQPHWTALDVLSIPWIGEVS